MDESGTNFGPELLVTLTPGAGRRVQLENALRDAVRTGRLLPGQRLPASRVLANDLGVSRRLVVDAYGQLVAEGYLTARSGSGTHVCERPDTVATPAITREPPPISPLYADMRRARPPRWDLRPGIPSLAHFPRRQWRRAWVHALTRAENTDFGYPDPAGHRRLRAELAAYLARVRGVDASPETVLVCGGFTQGLDLVCRTLRAAGARTIALENLGLPHRIRIIESAALTALPIPVDAEGLVVDALPDHGVDAVLITPAHQFPTGVVLSPQRRDALVSWATRTGAVVIEDDYDGEFRFDRRAVGAVQGRARDSVVYIGTGSKTLAPALRVGWIVAPADLMDGLHTTKFHADAGSSTIDQLALAEMIACGDYDRHIRQSRIRYRANYQALREAIDRHRIPLRLAGIPAGLQTLAALPPDCDVARLVANAATAGVGLISSDRFHTTQDRSEPALVIGYGNISPGGIDQAIAALAGIMAEA